MQWLFITLVAVVLWLIQKQFNEISKGINDLEIKINQLTEEIAKSKQ